MQNALGSYLKQISQESWPAHDYEWTWLKIPSVIFYTIYFTASERVASVLILIPFARKKNWMQTFN
jgi:hypothetical protein